MKKLGQAFALVFVFMIASLNVSAHHIKGGWIGYKYLGQGYTSDYSKYEVTVYLYIDCNNVTSYRASVILGVFDAATNLSAYQQEIYTDGNNIMRKQSFSPCITNRPDICYNVYTYTTTINLLNNAAGYNVNVQFRARVDNIINIYNSDNTGITLFTQIPGQPVINNKQYNFSTNNNPEFNFLDTSVVCHSSQIAIPFSATDPDGDSLSYAFGPGNDAGGDNNNVLVTPSPPPYPLLTYVPPYSGAFPLGQNVVINARTGLITGKAPDQIGEYVVAVYVQEWRDGILINTTKKELQIDVTDCSLLAAVLDPSYINCTDYTFYFKNNSSNPNTATYLWNFGVDTAVNNLSTLATPTFTYPDTGIYTLKLKIAVSGECADSTTSEIKVYPGFYPDFNIKGQCILSASQFEDSSKTKNGIVNSWLWNFGDNTTSTEQNPKHQYQQPGNYNVLLQVGNSKGCSDTVSNTITIFDSVAVKLLFTDSTICNKDSIQLVAQTSVPATYQWTPNDSYILGSNTNTPTVFPKSNTEYTVTASNGDCAGTAIVHVNLLGQLNLSADNIYACIGDSATFNVATQANNYSWSTIQGTDVLNSYIIQDPSLLVKGNDTYHLKVAYGKNCSAEKDVQVLAAPYPTLKFQANDTTICMGTDIELKPIGNTTDDLWKPTNQSGPSITVRPEQSTTYIVDGYDRNSYCTKHVQDTIVVNISPKFNVYLPHDTTIVLNQPLVLKPITDAPNRRYTYMWNPTNYLNYADSSTVIVNIPKGITQQFYTLNMQDAFGCTATAQTTVHIFQTATEIFVPSAFTPNDDGKNDIVKPILAGIKQFNYFRIYNRWGQLVYTTNTPGQGWNGRVNGQLPSSGTTFIYQVSGVDFNNKKIEKSGTIVLIR